MFYPPPPTLSDRFSFRTSAPEFDRSDFKFFVHAIGDSERNGRQTLMFSRGTEGYPNFKSYGHSFEEVLTEKDPDSPPDAGRFSLVVKVPKHMPSARHSVWRV